jgi:hypothetical protein
MCLKAPANQTGSHIFSWFLIRGALNRSGSLRRNNEVAFELSTEKFVQTYFGSEVPPEQIKAIKGRELSDEEIENMTNPITKDYILCSNCEKRLSVVESIVQSQYFEELRNLKVNASPYAIHVFGKGELLRLFVYSLAWRASIVQQDDFKLDGDHQEKLRRLLDTNLSRDKTVLDQNILTNSIVINRLPLLLTFVETIGENSNSLFCSWTRKPYAMILNDFSFQLFFTPKHTKRITESLFGINEIIPPKKVLNMDKSQLLVGILPDQQRKLVNRKLGGHVARKIMGRAVALFKTGFEELLHRPCPRGIADYFRWKVVFGSDNQVEKYTPEHFTAVAMEVMQEYQALLHRVNRNNGPGVFY